MLNPEKSPSANLALRDDFEQAASHAFTIIVNDDGAERLSAQATVTVAVNDEPEAPRFSSEPIEAVDQGGNYNYPIAVDEDNGAQLTISLERCSTPMAQPESTR